MEEWKKKKGRNEADGGVGWRKGETKRSKKER